MFYLYIAILKRVVLIFVNAFCKSPLLLLSLSLSSVISWVHYKKNGIDFFKFRFLLPFLSEKMKGYILIFHPDMCIMPLTWVLFLYDLIYTVGNSVWKESKKWQLRDGCSHIATSALGVVPFRYVTYALRHI